jgi:hypothetical protein
MDTEVIARSWWRLDVTVRQSCGLDDPALAPFGWAERMGTSVRRYAAKARRRWQDQI